MVARAVPPGRLVGLRRRLPFASVLQRARPRTGQRLPDAELDTFLARSEAGALHAPDGRVEAEIRRLISMCGKRVTRLPTREARSAIRSIAVPLVRFDGKWWPRSISASSLSRRRPRP